MFVKKGCFNFGLMARGKTSLSRLKFLMTLSTGTRSIYSACLYVRLVACPFHQACVILVIVCFIFSACMFELFGFGSVISGKVSFLFFATE